MHMSGRILDHSDIAVTSIAKQGIEMLLNSPNPTDVHAGSRLRFQRQVRQLSQTDVANALGITFQQVQKYEKGTNRISASRLQALTNILGVSISFFFENGPNDTSSTKNGDERGSQEDGITQFLVTTDGLKLNRAFLQIKDQKVRRAVIALVKALADEEETNSEAS